MESFSTFSKKSDGLFPDSKRIFLKDGAFYDWQEILRQPGLGRTLARIARGERATIFTTGETAQLLAKAMKANGG